MYWILSIIVYIVLAYYLGFRNKKKRKGIRKYIVIKKIQPVIVEILPKGTSSKPLICKVDEDIYFKVLGYSDYKKVKPIGLNGSCISWHKDNFGKFRNLYGVENVYSTPSVKGDRDIWVKYCDNKLKTSVKVRILVEV